MRRRRCALRRTLLPTLAALALAAAAVAAPTGARAQAAPAGRWVVTRDAFADLWYHGLAVVGAEGYGPLPLYSAAYRADARSGRRERGATTRLDGAVTELRAELRADSAYEVLHFVPPYFVGEAPVAVLGALRSALAQDGGMPRFERGPLDARAAAVVSALPTARERRTLRAFVDLLDDEWRTFVREDRVTRAPDAAAVARLQAEWDHLLAPPLASYLDALSGGRGGVIVVVPAVGAEGRIVTGAGVWRPVVVTAGDGGEHAAPLLAAVRELSFGLLDDGGATRGESANRLAAARARDVAAVRAGALVLEEAAPALVESYRAMFAAAAGASSFEKQYPLDARSERALRAAVSRHLAAARAAARRPAQR